MRSSPANLSVFTNWRTWVPGGEGHQLRGLVSFGDLWRYWYAQTISSAPFSAGSNSFETTA